MVDLDRVEKGKQLLAAVTRVVGPAKDGVPLHAPWIGEKEKAKVMECLDSGWVSTAGPMVSGFEEKIREITGSRAAVAMNSGTSALHVALLVSGIEPGDEVMVPSLTFVATVNAIRYAGGIPCFVDVEGETGNVDPVKLEEFLEAQYKVENERCLNRKSGRRVKALVPVHVFGHPCRMDELKNLSRRWKMELIEDAAAGLGSLYRQRHVGTHGRMGVLSLNGNKIVTSGMGGALLLADEEDERKARHLSTTAKLPHPWRFDHDEVGFNYRLPSLNAALGIAQLDRLGDFLNRKRELALAYTESFRELEWLAFVSEPEETRSNYWLCSAKLKDPSEGDLDYYLNVLISAGYHARPVWTPQHEQMEHLPREQMDLTETQKLGKSLLSLPSSPNLIKS